MIFWSYKKIKNKALFWASVSLILYVLFPVTRILPDVIKGAWVLFSFLAGAKGIFFNNTKNKAAYAYVILFALLINLLIYAGEYRLSGAFSFFAKYIVMFVFWLPFLYGAWYSNNNDENAVIIIKNLIFWCLIVTCVTTIIGQFVYPDAARLLADNDTETHRVFQSINIGGYGFSYALAISVPYLIGKIRFEKDYKYIPAIVVFGVTIILQNYVFAMILYILLVIVSLLLVQNNKDRFLKFAFVFIVVFVIVYFAMLKNPLFWEWFMKLFKNNTVLTQRFGDIQNFFLDKTATGDISYRSSLYDRSFDAFKNSPIFGNVFGGNNELSRHSEAFDYLGGTGIFGLVMLTVYIVILCKLFNKPMTFCDKSLLFFAFATVVVLAALNTVIGSVEISMVFVFEYLTISTYKINTDKGNGYVLKKDC